MAASSATTSTAMFSSASDSCSRRASLVANLHVRPTRSCSAFLRTSCTISAQARTFAPLCSSSSAVNAAMPTEASAKVIDGKSVAKQIREEIATEVSRMKESTGIVPGLAVILVGDRKDSATYVRNKKKACESVGIKSFEVHLHENCSEQEVLEYITVFNEDPSVNGILVQLPLPSHMNEQNILNAVCIEKDVDGFNPLNIGRLAMRDREPLFVPCTPKGCIELLRRYDVPIKGRRAVVIGRSNIVGMPAALLLQDTASPRGYRLVGDVCYEEASKIASAITPVPGGVGPMTIAMLLSNTLAAAKRANNIE
ncbi:bifunctional protein folD [Striga asiatica]|uniref:Bifunctional protein folD n=1 Tax=Striga asiatica TaxID=4170 RepID=A0A5A7Q4Q8_STRAF|nr:bifunctional protein folD [Striga asiatica]